MAYGGAHFGEGIGPIQLDNVDCTGSEVSLLQCGSSTVHDCSHSEDAGVLCKLPGTYLLVRSSYMKLAIHN